MVPSVLHNSLQSAPRPGSVGVSVLVVRGSLGGMPAWTHLPGGAAAFRRMGPHLGPSGRQNEDAEKAGAGRSESEQAG